MLNKLKNLYRTKVIKESDLQFTLAFRLMEIIRDNQAKINISQLLNYVRFSLGFRNSVYDGLDLEHCEMLELFTKMQDQYLTKRDYNVLQNMINECLA